VVLIARKISDQNWRYTVMIDVFWGHFPILCPPPVSTYLVTSVILNKRFISYFKEPDIGFNDIDQLIELPNSVNERIRVQVRNIQ
jgi:hypothetical protein